MALLSILGLYNYDPAVFDGFIIPARIREQRGNIIQRIVEECAELELLFPNWDYMASSISMWSETNALQWEKLVDTLFFDYDPISNYDRKEEWSDSASGGAKIAAYDSATLVDSSAGTSESTHHGRVSGNIGVTTTQQMIDEERRVAAWSFADYIVSEFKKRYCLLVY